MYQLYSVNEKKFEDLDIFIEESEALKRNITLDLAGEPFEWLPAI